MVANAYGHFGASYRDRRASDSEGASCGPDWTSCASTGDGCHELVVEKPWRHRRRNRRKSYANNHPLLLMLDLYVRECCASLSWLWAVLLS